MRVGLLLVLSLSVAACQCGVKVQPTDAAPVSVNPTALTFDPTFIGTTRSSTIEVTNPNRAAVALSTSTEGPFEVSGPTAVEGGGGIVLSVTFRPTSASAASGQLRVNEVVVPLTGEGREAPRCGVEDACSEGLLDAQAMQCVVRPRDEGAACSDGCVNAGACRGGRCVGIATRCDDGDPCTDDACGENGSCIATLTECPPPTAPCRVPLCERLTGCGSVEAPDGTLCGPDDCLATTVDVCVEGQCVNRQRPASARCSNTWVPAALGALHSHGVAFDEVSGTTLLTFAPNGQGQQSWRWDGARWEFLLPNQELPDRTDLALAWNPLRRRVMAFGGLGNNETWEWDGATWAQLRPSVAPECGHQPSLVYDPTTRHMLLSCTFVSSSSVPQLWSFDGVTWRQRPSPPTALRLLVDAPTRTVLGLDWGGHTHRWDGARFHEVGPAPPIRTGYTLGVDPLTGGAVVLAGTGQAAFEIGVWRWSRTEWRLDPAPVPAPVGAEAAFDKRRNRLVLTGGGVNAVTGETWEWDGVSWERKWNPPPWLITPSLATGDGGVWLAGLVGAEQRVFEFSQRAWKTGPTLPSTPAAFHLAFDVDAQRLYAIGARDPGAETFVLDGSRWTRVASTAGPGAPRVFPSVAYSPAEHRVLLFGGTNPHDGLWEFDGTTWRSRAEDGGPGALYAASLVADQSGAPLLLGGVRFAAMGPPPQQLEVFRWSAGTWSTLPALPVPGWTDAQAATDPTRGLLLAVSQDPNLLVPNTWEWNGTAWRQRQPSRQLPRLGKFTMAFDPSLGKVLLHDGFTTWAFLP